MSNILKYRPWKLYIYFVPFLVFSGLAFIVIASLYFNISLINFCISLLLGALSFVLVKVLYDSYNVVILFSPQVIEITEKKQSKAYKYTEFLYGYYGRSYKGHLFLVLSNKRIDKKQVKLLCNKSANYSKICFDDTVVIPIGNPNNKNEIEKFVDNNLMIIQCQELM